MHYYTCSYFKLRSVEDYFKLRSVERKTETNETRKIIALSLRASDSIVILTPASAQKQNQDTALVKGQLAEDQMGLELSPTLKSTLPFLN